MKKVIVTGAAGLMGYDLVSALLAAQYEVWILGRSNPFALSSNVHWINIDLQDKWDCTHLPEKADAVFHLAQSEHFREFPEKAESVFAVNTLSTLQLLNYAVKSGAKRFIYASSGGIYGFGDKGFSEEDEIRSQGDLGFYIGTKHCSEILVENYLNYFNVAVLRFFFVYGKRQRKNMLIPRLVSQVSDHTPIQIQGTEGIKINPIYVSDAVNALFNCLSLSGNHKINIGGSEILSLKNICDIIGKLLAVTPNYAFNPAKTPASIYGDITKMCKLLHTPIIHFSSGIKNLI